MEKFKKIITIGSNHVHEPINTFLISMSSTCFTRNYHNQLLSY